ncbi:uncharacterized protein Tco025E_08202, partial [Trypanosoma conorhini]
MFFASGAAEPGVPRGPALERPGRATRTQAARSQRAAEARELEAGPARRRRGFRASWAQSPRRNLRRPEPLPQNLSAGLRRRHLAGHAGGAAWRSGGGAGSARCGVRLGSGTGVAPDTAGERAGLA